jgi:sugar phosphate isomerase/epimerase
MKLGVITDGISRELEHALSVMNETGIENAEFQFIWDKEVGDLSDSQMNKVQSLVRAHEVNVSCISRHIMGGLSVKNTELDSPDFIKHMDALKRCIKMAKELDCPLVRVMSFSKEMILFGSHGAEAWNVSNGAWDKFVKLMEVPVQIAEDEGIKLVVETGNNAMITSAWLSRKLMDDLGTDKLRLLWDPANSLYCNETPFPDGYEAVKGGYIGHIHMKDAIVDIPKATLTNTELGKGQMAPHLKDIAHALRQEKYPGSISFESVYRPLGGTFEDGYRASLNAFKEIFSA